MSCSGTAIALSLVGCEAKVIVEEVAAEKKEAGVEGEVDVVARSWQEGSCIAGLWRSPHLPRPHLLLVIVDFSVLCESALHALAICLGYGDGVLRE